MTKTFDEVKQELRRDDLQELLVCRMAAYEADMDQLLTRLRVDADKLRCYDTFINDLLKVD